MIFGLSKQRLEFSRAEVAGICVREEGAQEICVRGPPWHTDRGKIQKPGREQPVRSYELTGDSGEWPVLKDMGFQ